MSRDELMDSIIEKVHIIANATSMRELDIAHGCLREDRERFSLAHRRRLNFERPIPELRNKPSYDESNEFGQLWNGSTVVVLDQQHGDYVLVAVTHCAYGEYGANVEGRIGYVNVNFLK